LDAGEDRAPVIADNATSTVEVVTTEAAGKLPDGERKPAKGPHEIKSPGKGSRDRFYETPFRPKNFRTIFLGQISARKQQIP
jgi:hypothetical protein